MKSEKTVWGLTLGSILLQWYCMYDAGLYDLALPFATGFSPAGTIAGSLAQTLLLPLIPFPFLLWIFSGRMAAIFEGYGKVYLIRQYSRTKLMLRAMGRIFPEMLVLQGFGWAVFQGLSHADWAPLTGAAQCSVMVLYTAALTVTVWLQCCLELVMRPPYAQLVTLLYCTVCLFVGSSVGIHAMGPPLRWIFFLCLGITTPDHIPGPGNGDDLFGALAALCAIGGILLWISLKIAAGKDIM